MHHRFLRRVRSDVNAKAELAFVQLMRECLYLRSGLLQKGSTNVIHLNWSRIETACNVLSSECAEVRSMVQKLLIRPGRQSHVDSVLISTSALLPLSH